jgi:hypothetical protein
MLVNPKLWQNGATFWCLSAAIASDANAGGFSHMTVPTKPPFSSPPTVIVGLWQET